MKKIVVRLVVTAIGIAVFAVPIFSQNLSDQECDKIYNEQFLRTDRKAERPYLAAKEYLEKCPQGDKEIRAYLKNWVVKYEWLKLLFDFEVAFGKDDFPNIYKYGREILDKSPEEMAELIRLKVATGNENVGVTIKMGFAGYNAERKSNNTSYRSDATKYAKQAIEILNSGKAPNEWKPFKDKEDALAWLHFALGYMLREPLPKDSAAYFYKSSQYNSPIKSTTATSYYIFKYFMSEYVKINKTIEEKCPTDLLNTDECRTLDEKRNFWQEVTICLDMNQRDKNDSLKKLSETFKTEYSIINRDRDYCDSLFRKVFPDSSTKPDIK